MIHFIKTTFAKNKKLISKAFCCAIIFIFFISVYKDVSLSQPMPIDLRNRIVGARMMNDGLSPYFYTWKAGQPVKYYDVAIFWNFIVSGVTSTPFFNAVFGFVANLPQAQLNVLWFLVQCVALVICALLAFSLQTKQAKKKTWPFILAVMVAFTFTIGWRVHVLSGQNYIFIPLLAMACCYFLMRGKNLLNVLLFSVCAVSLILIRPIGCLFFLPLVFFPRFYTKWTLASLAIMAIYIAFVFYSPVQKLNWTDYFTAMPIHVKIHQGFYENQPDSAHQHLILKNFEGISSETVLNPLNPQQVQNLRNKEECRNFYIIYEKYVGKRPAIKTMSAVGMMTIIIILLPMFWFVRKKTMLSAAELLLIGFVVYEVISFCSPIMRPNYCWVEFLFPLLMAPLLFKKVYLIQLSFLLIGFCLNIFAPTFIPMRQNIGEWLIIIALLGQIYRPIFISFFMKYNGK